LVPFLPPKTLTWFSSPWILHPSIYFFSKSLSTLLIYERKQTRGPPMMPLEEENFILSASLDVFIWYQLFSMMQHIYGHILV
jgi:hypothetical protein